MRIPKRFLRSWDTSHKVEFHRGMLRGLTEQERAFALKLIATNTKTLSEDDKRLYLRLILFFSGDSMNVVPKEAAQECPHCGYEIEHFVARHIGLCKAKKEIEKKSKPKIDSMVWEMLGGRL